mmetsp:Transcript_23050/g.30510  ORF Transcript_23050/g.30510 Transcript_23050/m.30510 type:complete len:226 (-) Transcript_23050:2505-3182(-)
MCKSRSISRAASVNFLLRSLIEDEAVLYLSSHEAHSFSDKKRTPRTRVRRPSEANSPRCAWIPSRVDISQLSDDSFNSSPSSFTMPRMLFLSILPSLLSLCTRCFPPVQTLGSSIDESAPLHKSKGNDPSSGGDLTRTDILFLSESNLLIARTFHLSYLGTTPSDSSLAGFSSLDGIGRAVLQAKDFAVSLPPFNMSTISLSFSNDGERHFRSIPEASRPTNWNP